MVADKAAAPQGLHAVLVDVFSHMALGAVIHFHAIPGIAFNAGDIFAPDIDTVSGNPVFLIDP
jgi:hypothetical protein